ncbi:hypothetical protein IE53DRAFT_5415 [Violaceomyces palustris]|uniref:Uncharacterized protein n=1 Tax=Violaceomyces palustris TaxID=1673888 RepID=A0ACD0NLV8_9BASI|nr:hypothetical protein IE53DRAFT_5415 [Violaceomyces palustris]
MTSTPNTIPDEVSILILGGLSHTARSHLTWLISKEGEEERLVEGGGDKVPKVKYIDPPCLRALEDPRVEYIQMNLSIPENLKKAFTPPEDKGGLKFDIVYDLIGEGVIHSEIPEEVLLEKQVKVCHMAGLEAKRRGVSVYLRETVHFMTVGVDQPAAKEGDEVKPRTARAYWYYETERALACVEGLNLVIVRPASVFGPHIFHGLSIPRFGMGSLYRVTGETMKWLWGPNLKVHTIHPRDLARANWKISLWAMERGRERTESEAGEVLEPVRIKDSSKSKEGFREKVGLEQGCCPRDRSPKVAVFNVVDDEDMDQLSSSFPFTCGKGIRRGILADFSFRGTLPFARPLQGESF